MSVSLIVTTLNEASTIESLLLSIKHQSLLPNEVIIVDGGSQDGTVKKITDFSRNHPKLAIKTTTKPGNRSIGRNTAIQMARYSLIAITDAGCTLDKHWLETLLKTHQATHNPVVAGYYSAKPATQFQAAVVPYVLVMPDAVDPATFLPATRSLLIERSTFFEVGGFDESLSDNEDYAFAKELQRKSVAIAFAKNAVVYWQPPRRLKNFFTMLFRFARGDIYAGIIRPKVLLLFARYLVAITLFLAALIFQAPLGTVFFLAILFATLYCFWAVLKNIRYAPKAWYWLPVLQFTADGAVLSGSLLGFLQRLQKSKN